MSFVNLLNVVILLILLLTSCISDGNKQIESVLRITTQTSIVQFDGISYKIIDCYDLDSDKYLTTSVRVTKGGYRSLDSVFIP